MALSIRDFSIIKVLQATCHHHYIRYGTSSGSYGSMISVCWTLFNRPWHDMRVIARAHAVTHANQEKGGLGGQ